MDTISSQPFPSAGSIFTPLIIAIGGIIASSLVVVLYHTILLKYWPRNRQQQQQQQGQQQQQYHLQGPERRRIGCSVEIGLSKEVLKTIPVLFFSERMKDLFRMDLDECIICLGRLEKGDIIRWLPNCGHAFHLPCIDNWLHGHASCPLCRTPVVAPSRRSPFPSSPNLRDLLAHVYIGDGGNSTSSGADGAISSRSNLEAGSDMDVDMAQGHNELIMRPRELAQCPRLKRSFSMDHSSVIINVLEAHRRGETEPHPPFIPLASKGSFFGFGMERGGSTQC